MKSSNGSLGICIEENVPIPMRDGTILRANIMRPHAPGKFPGILVRTVYGKSTGGVDRLVRAGYVCMHQDTRGRHASDGEFCPFTVEHTGEAEDGYDSVEWLASQPYCDGNVGTMGGSYDAWMQWQLARLRPPHLQAMCAWSIPTELTELDWPGAFKPARRIHWWFISIGTDLRRRHGLPGIHTRPESDQHWADVEQGRWLWFLPWRELPRYLPKGLAAFAEEWLHDPGRTPWRFSEHYADIKVPNLDFSGWYDHCNDSIHHLAGMQSEGGSVLAREACQLVIGPWSHPTLGQRRVGKVDFGPQAEVDRTDLIIRWFDHWLKGIDNGVDQQPPVRYFMMGEMPDCERWKAAPCWPPPDTQPLHLYLGPSTLKAQPCDSGPDQFIYDPHDPVPTLWSPKLFTEPADRHILDYRPDILRYTSEPLDTLLDIVGEPTMVLHASSSARDTDFFARLVDEYPGGPAREISYGFVRARYRNGLEHEELLEPGQITEYQIKLGPTACRIASGHRIRVEITSSDFPNHDRNHNTGGDDLGETELRIAKQLVYHDEESSSHLILPILKP